MKRANLNECERVVALAQGLIHARELRPQATQHQMTSWRRMIMQARSYDDELRCRAVNDVDAPNEP